VEVRNKGMDKDTFQGNLVVVIHKVLMTSIQVSLLTFLLLVLLAT
jgi:hypothetical protein